MKHDAPSRILRVCAVLLLSSVVHASQTCPVEVKLVLSPEEGPDTIASFQLAREATGQVYFFDTDALDLLSRGVIVRLRHGRNNDLTVKVRPSTSKRFTDPSGGREDFKCEMDMIRGESNPAYSIRNKYSASRVPDEGTQILSLLSDGQKKLLKETGASIDWNRVKRIANIKSTEWNTVAQAPFGKLTLELWEWPSGSILELSTRVGPNHGQPSYAALVRLVNAKFLSINDNQRSKTQTVLEEITGHAVP
jgi:hypothetical protein